MGARDRRAVRKPKKSEEYYLQEVKRLLYEAMGELRDGRVIAAWEILKGAVAYIERHA